MKYAFKKICHAISDYGGDDTKQQEGIVISEIQTIENDDEITKDEVRDFDPDSGFLHRFTYELIGEINESEIETLKKFNALSEIEWTTKLED